MIDFTDKQREDLWAVYIATKLAKYKKAEADRLLAELHLTQQKRLYDLAEHCERQWQRPSRLYNIKLTFDGEHYHASYGEVVGSGDTPEIACDNFDHIWTFGAEA